MQQQQQAIPEFLRIIGVIAYSGFTILAVIWVGIGIDRARRISRKYYALSATWACAAIFAANLSIIATDPIWISRLMLTAINRAAATAGVIALAVYTASVICEDYRRDRILRQHIADDKRRADNSHSNTLMVM